MTEKKRFRMEIIEGASLPFIVDNDSAKKQSDKITSYHTYETDKKNKCLELVELLNTLHEENEQLQKENEQLKKKNQGLENDLLNKLNEQHDRNERLESINYQLSARCHDYEKSLYDGREYLKKLNEKFEKIFDISLEDFLNIEYKK